MGIKCTKTFHLSEENIKDIIAMYFKKQGYNTSINDVKLNIGTRCVGYGMSEHDETYFDGATVTCEDR